MCIPQLESQVGPKQRVRKLKVLKERADCALQFAKSFSLELVSLTFRDTDTYHIIYNNNNKIIKFLFKLVKKKSVNHRLAGINW